MPRLCCDSGSLPDDMPTPWADRHVHALNHALSGRITLDYAVTALRVSEPTAARTYAALFQEGGWLLRRPVR